MLTKRIGHQACGIDIDQLAVFLADSWATTLRSEVVLEAAAEMMTTPSGTSVG